MANKFLKRAMEIVKFDITTTGKEYASNLIKLKNDAKAVASQMQGESLVADVQNTYRRIKSGNIVKDISNWFYNNADELEAESLRDKEDDFDFGGPSDDTDEDKPKLSIPSSSESSKQLAAMYKIGAKQAEAALANTAELVTTINTRSSEIISAVNNVNSTLSKINSTLENKLEKLIQLSTVQIEAQTEKYQNDSMVDENGKLSLGKMYETFKSGNIVSTNPYVAQMMTILPMMRENASPEHIFNLIMSGLVREKVPIKGQTINQWGQTFNEVTDVLSQRIMRSFLENPTVKRLFLNKEQNTGGETDYSNYRINKYNDERAFFDNKTRQTIIDIIPGYLKSIDNALNHRELHINEYGKLTTENVQVNKFNAVTDKAIEIPLSDRRITKLQSSIEEDTGFKYSDDELTIALRALQATYVMYLERSGGNMLKTSDLNPDDMATINYAVKLIKTARGGSPQYWKTLCQTILLKLSGNIIDGERFIQSVSRSLINMRQEAINVAQSDYGDQAGTITDQMMKNTFRNLGDGSAGGKGNRYGGSEGTSSSGGTPPTGGGNPPSNPPSSPEADDIVDTLMTKLGNSRVGQILGLSTTPAGTDSEGNTDYIGQITSVASSVKEIGTNLTSAAKDTIKVKGNELISKAKEAATDKMHEVAERVAFKGVQQDFNKENLEKSSISDEDKLLVQQIMQMAQTATADGEVSQADIQSIKQMIDQIQDPNTKKRLNQSIIPMLNRVNSKNSEDGSGQNKGIVGKILAGVTLAFHKILTPIKAVIKLGFKGLKTVATKFFAPIIKLFKSGASDVFKGSSAVKESLFGTKDEEGNRTSDGLVQTFITNPAKSVLGVSKSIVGALHTGVVKPLTSGIADTFKNIFAERDKKEKEKPVKEEGSEKATDKIVDKFKNFMNSNEFGKGFMSVFNKEEERKKAAKLKTPESMSDVATNEMSEMISGKKESIFSIIRDTVNGIAENVAARNKADGTTPKKKVDLSRNPTTASEAVSNNNAAAGENKSVSALFNIGKMVGGIAKIAGGIGKMLLSAIAGLSGVKAIMTVIEKAFTKAVKPLNKAFNTIKKVITPIINTMSKYMNKIAETVSTMAISLVKAIQPIFENIGPIIELLFEAINPVLEALTPVLTVIVDVLVNVLKPVLAVLMPTLNSITGVLQTISGALKLVVGGIKWLVGFFKNDKDLKSDGKATIDSGLDNIKDGLGNVFNPTGIKVSEETEDTASSRVQEETTYQPIQGNVLDGTLRGNGDLRGSGDYTSAVEVTADPIVHVLREEVIPQIKPIVEILSKWLTPALVNIDKVMSTVGGFIKTISNAVTVVKGGIMTVAGFLTAGIDHGKLLKAGVSAVKQGLSGVFSSWKNSMTSLIKKIPILGDIVSVYTDKDGEGKEDEGEENTSEENKDDVIETTASDIVTKDEDELSLEETGSGNMASYGTYMNMSQRGCGPLALSENFNRRGGHVSASSLASGMGANGSYDPNKGTSVNGYINTARSMGMNLKPGTVTRDSLKTASAHNPITVLGSGSSYGTQNGNNHYVNVIGSRGSQVYVSNPLTGRVSKENASDFIAGSKVGLYGSGDLGLEFSEEVTDAMSELKNLSSSIFDIFKFDDDDDSYEAVQKKKQETEAAESANELLESKGSSLVDYEEAAYEKFKQDNPQRAWQSDKSYAKKWNKLRNKYLLEAAEDDIAEAYKSQYTENEGNSKYETDDGGSWFDKILGKAKGFLDGILTGGKDNSSSGGSTSGSSATAEKFISLAESDVGKNRSEVNCTSSTGGIDGDWCANYVSQVMKRSGYKGPFNFTVGYLLKAMEESPDWEKVDKDQADRGDVVFFDWQNPNPFDGSDTTAMSDPQRRWDHVGWVQSCDGNGTWNCIEGNAGGAQTVTKQTQHNPFVDTIMRFVADRTSSGGDLVGNSNKDKIWSFLVAPESSGGMGLSRAGAAGIMGNMENESGFEPNNLENEANKQFGMTDEEYTAAVNNGSYSKERFMHDHWDPSLTDNCGSGYGLVQFTWYTLKRDLYDYAMAHSKDISNLTDQLSYLKQSIINDKSRSFFESLQTISDPYNAATEFMRVYEGCQNQGSEGVERGNDARAIFDEYANAAIPSSPFQSTSASTSASELVSGTTYSEPIGPKTLTETYKDQIEFENGYMNQRVNMLSDSYKKAHDTGVAATSGNEQAINTGYEVFFKDAQFINSKGVTEYLTKQQAEQAWVVQSIDSRGYYNLRNTKTGFYRDGVPKSALIVHKNWDTKNSNMPSNVGSMYASGDIDDITYTDIVNTYGSGDINDMTYTTEPSKYSSINIDTNNQTYTDFGNMYGSGDETSTYSIGDSIDDIKSFYEPIMDTTQYQPSYQVINSSYDNMTREQMIQSISSIEFNVRNKHLEALVEQVIDKLDKQRNTAVPAPSTKNTNTQSMFTEEIPNQLMKLYS